MTRLPLFFLAVLCAVCGAASARPRVSIQQNNPTAKRLVILKVDGLNADLLYAAMRQIDPATGKSRLPWFAHIFTEQGTVFENFYTRGISLSAPSWSMLDTGHHTVIRGNVEYDRYTGHVYDYLNFFPFYLGYARHRQVDMPGVEVLDRAGIPLLIDEFPYERQYQSFQLYQRGVRWSTLKSVLERRFSSKVLLSIVENAGAPSYDQMLQRQTETELKQALATPQILYTDFFTGDIDHTGHETNNPAALLDALRQLDALAGRIWTSIQASPLAKQTIFAVVSDHGMNNVPGIVSQTYSLPDLFNSAAGGAHHVITNRVLMSDYKLRGLDPLVNRVTTASTVSFYLPGQASQYPTAWLDIDGNERASVQLRDSDLNKLHILLLQIARPDLAPDLRRAAAAAIRETIDCRRTAWTATISQLEEEMRSLAQAIEQRKKLVEDQPKKWTSAQWENGLDKEARRKNEELQAWEREHAEYSAYIAHLRALLDLHPDPERPFHGKIADFIPELALGDNNSVYDLQNYIAGPAANGLAVNASGKLDEAQSFRRVNNFSLLLTQRARNNPQAALPPHPIDFTAMLLPDSVDLSAGHSYWLYGGEEDQLIVHSDNRGRIALEPVRHLLQDADGNVTWEPQPWRAGLPLRLFEDANLRVPADSNRDSDRAAWLSAWHTEREWLLAIHMCKYSNGVIGVTEELSPVADNVPGPPGIDPILLRFERHRRQLVQADFQVFAADHWNFNARFPNPGGNHGAFFRISTHSVFIVAGAGVPNRTIEEPYDSLNFASTLLNLVGRTPPMPDRVVQQVAEPRPRGSGVQSSR